jgi:hypothetical protein
MANIGCGREVRPQELDGHVAPETQIHAPPHHTHASPPEHRAQLVAASEDLGGRASLHSQNLLPGRSPSGTARWMAHSKPSKEWRCPAAMTSKALS